MRARSGLRFGTLRVSPVQLELVSPSLSGANLVFNAINGRSGQTYYTLMTTNLSLPLNQWTRVATNVLSAAGDFAITLTNTVSQDVPARFYLLQTQ